MTKLQKVWRVFVSFLHASRRPAPAAVSSIWVRYLRLTKPAWRSRRYRDLPHYRRLTGDRYIRRHLCLSTGTCDSGDQLYHVSFIYRYLRRYLGILSDRKYTNDCKLLSGDGKPAFVLENFYWRLANLRQVTPPKNKQGCTGTCHLGYGRKQHITIFSGV